MLNGEETPDHACIIGVNNCVWFEGDVHLGVWLVMSGLLYVSRSTPGIT